MTVLVAVPIRQRQLDTWSECVFGHFNALTWPDKELALWPNDFATDGNGRKYWPNARARNELIDSCLRPEHSHVLWMDADLVDVPCNLIETLMAVSGRDVVAPFVYVEKPGGWFYDTGGFVRDGIGAAHDGPIYPGYTGGVIELDSVGTCYLAPADIYRAGLRYGVTAGEVEHRGLLMAAKALGYRVLATDTATVLHAYLPNYGEAWHL